MQILRSNTGARQGERPEKILVVDDDAGFRDMISYSLGNVGYAVTTASDGIEALEVLATEHPDLMILDVMMPGVNGYDVLKRMQSDPDMTTEVIIVSAAADVNIATLCVCAYLAKPFSSSQLVWLVERVLGGMARHREEEAPRIAA